MLSTKLKFDVCIADQRFSYYIDFGVSRMHIVFFFLTGYTKCHTLRPIDSKKFFHHSIVKLLESVQN